MTDTNDGFELATAFDEAANAVKARLFKDWKTLKSADRQKLEDEFWDIQSHAMRLRTIAVSKLLAGTAVGASDLRLATERATGAIAKLNDIRKAIQVATAVFGLAASVAATIAAPNPASIVASLGSLKAVLDAAHA